MKEKLFICLNFLFNISRLPLQNYFFGYWLSSAQFPAGKLPYLLLYIFGSFHQPPSGILRVSLPAVKISLLFSGLGFFLIYFFEAIVNISFGQYLQRKLHIHL